MKISLCCVGEELCLVMGICSYPAPALTKSVGLKMSPLSMMKEFLVHCNNWIEW